MPAVNVGKLAQSGKKREQRLERTGRIPGVCGCAQKRRRSTNAARIEETRRQDGNGIGEFTVDWSSPGSIPLGRMERTTMRFFW
jgi:hypothetical protein